jgi:hypothetical protein
LFSSKVANDAPHLVMAAHEENFQSWRAGAEQDADIQTRLAFKYIPS